MRAAILLTVAGLLQCAAQAGAEADAGERALQAFLHDVTTLSGRFEQQLVDADGTVVERSSGRLDVARPGRFRWAYDEPYEQLLVADGRNVWSYDVDLEQVSVRSQAEVLGSTPAALLGGTRDVLDDFDYVGSDTDRGTLWVSLRPRNADSGIDKVELGFTDGLLSRMMFTDDLDQATLIALLDMTFNEPIAPETFEFEPPDGVDVVGDPVGGSVSEN